MDALCQGMNISIFCTNYNTEMIRSESMQTLEVVVIEGNYNPFLCNGKSKDFFIGNAPIIVPGIFSGQYIMAPLTEYFHS